MIVTQQITWSLATTSQIQTVLTSYALIVSHNLRITISNINSLQVSSLIKSDDWFSKITIWYNWHSWFLRRTRTTLWSYVKFVLTLNIEIVYWNCILKFKYWNIWIRILNSCVGFTSNILLTYFCRIVKNTWNLRNLLPMKIN